MGRRYPRLPLAFLRALPLPLLYDAARAGAARDVPDRRARPLVSRRASRPRASTARRVRRPEDLGDFFLTPEVLKTRPEALVTGTAELAIESSGTSGHVTRVYLSRRELEYNARQGNLLLGALRPRAAATGSSRRSTSTGGSAPCSSSA